MESVAHKVEYTSQDVKDALKQNFGFEDFRFNQKDIIASILAKKDTFVIMPTGGGKSLCYQLPALMMPGCAIIISPLIALMKNQVDSIRGFSENNAVAHFLNSSLNKTQMREVKADILSGSTKMVFVAPETLTKEENIDFFREANVSFIAVDEAHCISEWGHDFRPEYRNIRRMVEDINTEIPLIALTATATPKVQSDIVKNLNMRKPDVFLSSFNRDNLFYEVRPKITKDQSIKEIVQYVKSKGNVTGIIYVQSRKGTEEIAKVLQLNGINAQPYHAGLDSKTRSRVQDQFLMEDLNVIVATIAFGMGIDKPDVRFVIHYDIPKSIENYYQETGRAGRDGIRSECLAYYSYKDILKLEKFLKDKGVAEKELAGQLMEEIIAYSETSSCRRQFLLHYFGEHFDTDNCDKMCDNCKNPKERKEVTDDMVIAVSTVQNLGERYVVKILVDFMIGKNTKDIKTYSLETKKEFGSGKEKGEIYWHSIFRQGIIHDLLYKEIEEYGLIKLSDKGKAFISDPYKVEIPINHDFSSSVVEVTVSDGGGAALDDTLLNMLKDLRKKEAKRLKLQPWVLFSENSLQDMATYYPLNKVDLLKISGVNEGKANKFGQAFIDLIADYVEENNIERIEDFIMKQVADKSKNKVAIIQSIDRKMPLEDIAAQVGLKMDELLNEMLAIVYAGTKLNLDYYIDESFDEDVVDEVIEYFEEAEDDNISEAFKELEGDDYTYEEVVVSKIKYMSEVAL